jgi:hypothetical protein
MKSIESGCKPFSIVDDGTRLIDDGKLHTIHFNIEQEVERIMRQFYKGIDDEVFKRLPKEKLIEFKSRIDEELKNRRRLNR